MTEREEWQRSDFGPCWDGPDPLDDDDEDWYEDDDDPYAEEREERERHIGWDAEPGDPYFDWSSLSLDDLRHINGED